MNTSLEGRIDQTFVKCCLKLTGRGETSRDDLFFAVFPSLQRESEAIAGRFDFVWTETGLVCLIALLLFFESS